MKKGEIIAEIRRLQDEIATPRIASVQERKMRLTEILRANFADYFEVVNGEIQWKEGVDKAKANSIFVISTQTNTDRSGNIISKSMSVRLLDPIKAAHELNKMDGIYKQHY